MAASSVPDYGKVWRMQYVAMFSGGVASYAAARRVVDEVGPNAVTLLFADTLIEDEDLIERSRKFWTPWVVRSPLAEPPMRMREDVIHELRGRGIEPPRLYAAGFAHNNCGGFCIKAGHGQFARLLAWNRERYMHHEAKEQEMRDYLGKDVAILRDRADGGFRPLTLREFRERIDAGWQPDLFDLGGCACMEPPEA